MKKTFYRITIIFVLLTITFVALDITNRSSSFTTPLDALENAEDPTLEVQEPIKTFLFDDYAYVFFYTELYSPKDFIAVSKFKKGKYGWKQIDIFGVGYLSPNIINGDAIHTDGLSVGLTTQEVSSVVVDNQRAALISLEEAPANIWFVQNNDSTIDLEVQFYDEEGKVID